MAVQIDETRRKVVEEQLSKDKRDLADLWSVAYKKYEATVADDDHVTLKPMTSVDEMVRFANQEMQGFKSWRHKDTKTDKLRTLLKDNLDMIQVGAEKLLQAAEPTFPPAAAIGTAMTYMLTACKGVSGSFDTVVAFHEDMHSFFERLTILERRVPDKPGYRNCLMDVFVCILHVCGFATKFIRQGRLKIWALTMIRGEDSELGDARKQMDRTLSRLQEATQLATLANTEDNLAKTDDLNKMMTELKQNEEDQHAVLLKHVEMFTESYAMEQDMRDEQRAMYRFIRAHSDGQARNNASSTAAPVPPSGSARIRSYLDLGVDPQYVYNELKESILPDTGRWLFGDEPHPLWEAWLSRTGPQILIIEGDGGVGKSCLAAAVYDHLVQQIDLEEPTSVVRFHFRESTNGLDLQSSLYFGSYQLENAIKWMIVQMAEHDPEICQQVNSEISREDSDLDITDWRSNWSLLVTPLFKTERRLQIVLDGLDELLQDRMGLDLIKFFQFLQTQDIKLKIFCTTRPSFLEMLKLENVDYSSMRIEKSHQLRHMTALIWKHFESDRNLRKFSSTTKQNMSKLLEDHSPNMLYTEQMLRKFNKLGRERLCAKLIENGLPKDVDEIHAATLLEIRSSFSTTQQGAVVTIFVWLTIGCQALTLGEFISLLNITGGEAFDLEVELQHEQLAKVLQIVEVEEQADINSPKAKIAKIQTEVDSGLGVSDLDLPLKIRDRSMRHYLRDSTNLELSFGISESSAHLKIFVACVKILQTKKTDVDQGLRVYAAAHWAFHLTSIKVEEEARPDQIEALQSLGNVMNNDSNIASTLEELNISYGQLPANWSRGILPSKMRHFVYVAQSLKDRLDPHLVIWTDQVMEDQYSAFIPLAKGHLQNLGRADDSEAARRSFRFAREALHLTSFSDAIIKFEEFDVDPVSETLSEIVAGTIETHYGKNEILKVISIFKDLKRDANSQWAFAALFATYKHHGLALRFAETAIKQATDSKVKVKSFGLMANIYLEQLDLVEAEKAIDECLSIPDITRDAKQMATLTKAKVAAASNQLAEAIESYEQSRILSLENELVPGMIVEYFDTVVKIGDDNKLMELLQIWDIYSQLEWMTAGYCNDNKRHIHFQRAAARTGQQALLISKYEEAIDVLQSFNADPPIRVEFAIAQWRHWGDVESAKKQLNAVLDVESRGDKFELTNQWPVATLVYSMNTLIDIIYEQFRDTGDRNLKRQLLDEARGLREKNLAQSIATWTTDLIHYDIVIGRMARKIGSAEEFETALSKGFDLCYAALTDNSDWNDVENLLTMARVVSNLKGLEKEAGILVSARFSQLKADLIDDEEEEEDDEESNEQQSADPGTRDDDDDNNDDNDDDDDDDDDDEEEEEDDDYELVTEDLDSFEKCSGECNPPKTWFGWKQEPAYLCVVCNNHILCEQCHKKQMEVDHTGPDKKTNVTYFGKNHKYVKAPVPGWKGIVNGMMKIDGESILFENWLKNLKEEKWPAAWERYWRDDD